MIELTAEQARAVERPDEATLMVNPATREEFVLIRRDRYEAMRKWVASLKRSWDNPVDDDLINKP